MNMLKGPLGDRVPCAVASRGTMRTVLLTALLAMGSCAKMGGPMSFLKPDLANRKAEEELLMRQVDELRRADGEVPPPPPLEDAPADTQLAPAPAKAERGVISPGGTLGLRRVRSPVVLAVAAGAAGWRLVRVTVARREAEAVAELEAASGALSELLGTSVKEELPRGRPAVLALAAELRERHALLCDSVLPLYGQLELKPPATLLQRSAKELEELSTTLAERVRACAAVLEQYESLGQAPPPTFRSWGVAQLEERAANMTAKAEVLREIVALDATLGRVKMDWELPAWDEGRLRSHADALAEKSDALLARKEKEGLLGKVEAALWLRKQEAPVALATLSADELRELLKKLNAAPRAAKTKKEM